MLPLVASGLLNKQAAAELGISETTLQIHSSNIMKKMEAPLLPELARIAAKLEIPMTHSRRPHGYRASTPARPSVSLLSKTAGQLKTVTERISRRHGAACAGPVPSDGLVVRASA